MGLRAHKEIISIEPKKPKACDHGATKDSSWRWNRQEDLGSRVIAVRQHSKYEQILRNRAQSDTKQPLRFTSVTALMAAQFFHHQLVSGLAPHFGKSQTQRLRGRKEWFKIQGTILQENIEGN